mmetsp:Transcript_6466/g.9952  ORF Transcript_6466/g.9952 Transcript_6466/m.9952 type:complete len:536 (+) Transcript_6466:90-1697(+)
MGLRMMPTWLVKCVILSGTIGLFTLLLSLDVFSMQGVAVYLTTESVAFETNVTKGSVTSGTNESVAFETKGSSWIDNKEKELKMVPISVEDNWVDRFDFEDLIIGRSSLISKLNSEEILEFGEADIDEILKPRYEAKDIPKIFVYDLPKSMKETLKLSKLIQMQNIDHLINANVSSLSLTHTNQYALDKFLADALTRRKHYVTKNPQEADLFFMPFKHNFLYRAKSFDPEFVCIHPDNKTMFEHLNSNTACRHFHATGAVGLKCRGEIDFQRHIFSGTINFMSLELGFDVPYPNYASNFTNDDLRSLISFISKTWTNRSYLASAHFGLHGYTTALQLRLALMTECMDRSDCLHMGHIWTSRKKQIEEHVLAYFNSVFCLQPPGDTYSRKAMVDCMVGGCIPVLFFEEQLRLWTHHIPWYEVAVFIPPEKHKETFRILEHASPSIVRRLQHGIVRALPQIALRSTSSLTIGNNFTDVVDTSLVELWKEVRDRQLYSGNCPTPAPTTEKAPVNWSGRTRVFYEFANAPTPNRGKKHG